MGYILFLRLLFSFLEGKIDLLNYKFFKNKGREFYILGMFLCYDIINELIRKYSKLFLELD